MEKDTIFRKKNQISNLASIYEHLVLKYLIALWKSFICDDLIELMLKQTLLYGRQEKNIDFDITAGELLRFFWHYLFTGYHSVPSEQFSWSNQPDLVTSCDHGLDEN